MRRVRVMLIPLALLAGLLVPGVAAAAGVTNSGDDLRTGWYPDQPSLSPATVGGGSFGQLWSANVTGQVYAQPLLEAGTLLVATEANQVYGLDPSTGGQRWNTSLGVPWNASDLGCGDLTPTVGVTATPVIDKATDTAYLTSKTYAHGTSGAARWLLHALDMGTGQERAGFPVVLQGTAQNAPARTFDPTHELQRPGLLLLDGVIYAAFGSHCDFSPWQGWIFGVSTAGAITARWIAVTSGDGAGIWQSGSGLMSDGPGRIVVGTGNPGAPSTPTAGTSPPGNLGESIVRLQVQPDGSLKPADFFAPFDAANLDLWDADFASGGPVALPDAYFGTAGTPHLLVAVGKEGYVYLLDRDHLGGIGQGPSGSDAVVQRIGPAGGVWSRPAVWPGDGGYVYIPTASPGSSGSSSSGTLDVYAYGTSGDGKPALSLAGRSSDAFGFSSSAPVITSDGTTSGSALVWTVWTASGSGRGAQLRAYDPVPVGGRPVLRWSAPIGTSAKFAMPGVGANRLYVGTRDGTVLGFGSPVTPPLAAPSALDFPATVDGGSTTRTLTLSANDAVTISSIGDPGGEFSLGTPSQALPAALGAGETLTIPVTFSPPASGPAAATLTVHTNKGDIAVGLSGTGRAAGPELTLSPVAVSFGGAPVGGHLSGTATLRNTGSQDLVVDSVGTPAAPFGVSGAPAAGDHIAPGDAVNITLTFDPQVAGSWTGDLTFATNGGDGDVGLSGTAGTPGRLAVTAGPVDFGPVAYGQSATRELQIANTGETPVTITKSKPPSGGDFTALDALAEGTVIGAGETRTLRVRFTPTLLGPDIGTWLITGNDSTGLHTVGFTGSGTAPWTFNGDAHANGAALDLTYPNVLQQAGTAFWPQTVDPGGLTVDFDTWIGGGSGADGLAFVIGDAGRGARATSVGAAGGGLGFAGIPGVAVALDTHEGGVFGIADGPQGDGLHWLASQKPAGGVRGPHHVQVTIAGGTLTATFDGGVVAAHAVTLPAAALLGFAAGTGTMTDKHEVTNVRVSGARPVAAPPEPTRSPTPTPSPSVTPTPTPGGTPEPPVGQPPLTLPPDLVAWWTFAEGSGRHVSDVSGHGHGGTLRGGASWTRGHIGGGLALGGGGDRMTVPRATALGLRHAFTLEAWVRPGRGVRSRVPLLAAGRAFALDVGTSGGGPAIEARAGGVLRLARAAQALAARRWTHLAATWDGHVLRLYVDGRRVASRGLAGRLAALSGPLVVGGGFRGVVDELRVSNRALPASQLRN